MPSDSPVPTEAALLVEYSTSQAILAGLDTRVWSVYSVVTTVAVGALIFTTQSGDLALSLLVGSGVMINLAGWWLMASRWWFYGDVALARMRQIEVAIGLSLTRQLWWAPTDLSGTQISALAPVDRRPYELVRAANPVSPFPRLSQRRGALVSIIGLGLVHGGAMGFALAAHL